MKKKVAKRRRARTPSARDIQVASSAMNLAEQMILDGTATSQIITYFLDVASPTEVLKRKKLQVEIELLEAKRKSIEAAAEQETIYAEAIAAFKTYSGKD